MKLSIASDDRDHAILVCDEDHNDIAEFYHSDHATVGQSYETALKLARALVEAANAIPTLVASTCDCGFSAEVCKTNPCMRKKMATSGLAPEAKYPHLGVSAVSVDQGRPACGQGDEWARKPTDKDIGGPKS